MIEKHTCEEQASTALRSTITKARKAHAQEEAFRKAPHGSMPLYGTNDRSERKERQTSSAPPCVQPAATKSSLSKRRR